MQQKGQTLVEAIVIIAMVMLMVTGLISGTTASLKSSQSVKARSEATKYAEDGMELIRLMRDNKWSTVADKVGQGPYCFGSNGVLEQVTCPPTPDTHLTRTATFYLLPDGETIHVHVAVSYPDGSTTITVPLDTYLTNWR
jgi:Tfp pilus assembly protein PilV